MKKAPEAFRTISEVADILDTPAHVLRFWESKFYQIRPVKRAGGRRYYRPDDVALINGIRLLLQDRGLTIRGVQRILQEKGVRHVIELGADLPAARTGAIAGAIVAEAIEPEDLEAEGLGAEALPEPSSEVPALSMAEAPADPIAPPAAPEPSETVVAFAPPRPAAAATPEDEPAPAASPRLSQQLRQFPREGLGPRRDRVIGIARRIDALLDRMSEASGAGRW